jgi:aldehyde dehydrogenase (NAD+)
MNQRTQRAIVNGTSFDLAAPFGGVKQSGIGRENGRYGLEEYFSPKAITRAQTVRNPAEDSKK